MSHSNRQWIHAVVVAYNRRALLERCLVALSKQTVAPDSIHVVDNASTDGTVLWLRQWLPTHCPLATLLTLASNTGGAGGFSTGLHKACEDGADWIWMMDDDARPHPDALEELLKVAVDPDTVYGSLAVHGAQTAWATTVLNPPLGLVSRADDVPLRAEVESIPFLGFLIHRSLVERIGLPDAELFIAADDAEFCLRARRAGAKVVIAGKSRIEHPQSQARTICFLGHQVIYLSLPPWKRYYDTRNRLLIARKYYGVKLLTQAIPGSFVRLFAALLKEPRKLAQAQAFFAGFTDGLLGIKGKRHEKWGIR